MIDTPSMRSIINHFHDKPGYVIAVDADSEISEQYQGVEGNEDELVRAEYDGTMKVHIDFLLTEFYLRSIKDGNLIMGEIHGKPGKVWRWVGAE